MWRPGVGGQKWAASSRRARPSKTKQPNSKRAVVGEQKRAAKSKRPAVGGQELAANSRRSVVGELKTTRDRQTNDGELLQPPSSS